MLMRVYRRLIDHHKILQGLKTYGIPTPWKAHNFHDPSQYEDRADSIAVACKFVTSVSLFFDYIIIFLLAEWMLIEIIEQCNNLVLVSFIISLSKCRCALVNQKINRHCLILLNNETIKTFHFLMAYISRQQMLGRIRNLKKASWTHQLFIGKWINKNLGSDSLSIFIFL